MNAQNGGPAFPRPMGTDGQNTNWEQDGMSMFDYYAGQALMGLLASGPHDCTPAELASDAELYANAMIRRRAARKGS